MRPRRGVYPELVEGEEKSRSRNTPAKAAPLMGSGFWFMLAEHHDQEGQGKLCGPLRNHRPIVWELQDLSRGQTAAAAGGIFQAFVQEQTPQGVKRLVTNA